MVSAMEGALNPIARAERQAAAQVDAFLAAESGPEGFGARLVELAGRVACGLRDGFHCRLPPVADRPRPDPTWLPVAASDLGARLVADGLIRHDEAANAWTWADDWFGAHLAFRHFDEPDPGELRETVGAMLRYGKSQTAEGVLALFASRWIEAGANDETELAPFLDARIGVEALAVAFVLRAPAGEEAGLGPALEAFTRALDGVFGSPRELERSRPRLREVQVLERAQLRLRGLGWARPARRLLLERLLHQNQRVLEMEPCHEAALAGAARARAELSGLEEKLPAAPAAGERPDAVLESSAGPEGATAPGGSTPTADEMLLSELRTSRRLVDTDPPRAVEAAQRALAVLARELAAEAIGCMPGYPTFDQLAKWLRTNGLLPGRLNHDVYIIEFGESLTGGRFEHHCLAALSRLARWYFGEYRGTGLPPELSAGPIPGPRSLSAGSGDDTAAPPAPGARGPAMQTTRRGRTRPGPRETEPSPRQQELARELGVPVRIEEPRTGMILLLVPGGELWMGGDPTDPETSHHEQPRLRVRLRPFYCGVAPVLQEEWARLLGPNRSDFPGPRRPATNFAWEELQEFLARANRDREGPPLRLLSEAEWEHAARAGTKTPYWWGESYRPGWANCSEEGFGSGRQETSEPGEYPPNPFGLLDIHGNVDEWCADFWHPTLAGHSPFGLPRERTGDDFHTVRGGSWCSSPPELRTSFRRCVISPLRFADTGFRCAMGVG